ncbi:MAG: hypothetical protein KGO05_01325, partial [Chloroflexota bacterium]|nr:hypothetical protein [Chloroflexota bacterium]
ILFALHLATYSVPSLKNATLATSAALAILVALLALAQHIVVFPVAATLPAPGWARLSAYVWLIGDMVSDLMQAGGVDVSRYLTLRLIVNVLAAVWLMGASWRAPLAMRIIGIFVSVSLVSYSLTAPFDTRAFILTLPSVVLLPIWFVLAGRLLDTSSAASPAQG